MWKQTKTSSQKKNRAAFQSYLKSEEKANATIGKYRRDVKAFAEWINDAKVTKETACAYKHYLFEEIGRVAAGVNAVLSALNSFFAFMNWDIKIKPLKIQKQTFRGKEKVLTKAEYERLLLAAKDKGNERLNLLLQNG